MSDQIEDEYRAFLDAWRAAYFADHKRPKWRALQQERSISDLALAVMIAQTNCPSGRFWDEEREDASALAIVTGIGLCNARRGLLELRRRSFVIVVAMRKRTVATTNKRRV
jgi:hypothetical protein